MPIRLLFVLVLSSASCFSKKQKNNNDNSEEAEIKCIRISKQFPYINPNGSVKEFRPDQTIIYFSGNQVLYQTYYYSAKITTKEEGESPNYKFVHYDFVYTKGKPYGLLFDNNKAEKQRIVKVDSMLSKEWSTNTNFNFLFVENYTKKISTNNIGVGEKEDLYSCINKKDTSMKGEFQLTFSKNKVQDIDYSFSKEIDSLNKMKLFKVVIVNYERFIKESNFHIDRIEVPYLLEELPVGNKKQLLEFFKMDKLANYPEN